MTASKPRCQLIGAGRAGRVLALAMARAGYSFTWIGSLHRDHAESLAGAIGCTGYGEGFMGFTGTADFLVIAVPDNQIAPVSSGAATAGIIGDETIVAHLSGALGSDTLDEARTAGASVMAFHPDQTLTPESDPETVFEGICIDMEGDERACLFGEQLASDLGAKSVRLTPDQRILTHLAMTIASNFTVSLVRIAEEIMESAGIDDTTVHTMLMPLFKQTARNIAESGTLTALTGPIARGDDGVVRRHLSALESQDEEYTVLYKAMARVIVRMAVERGEDFDERAFDWFLRDG